MKTVTFVLSDESLNTYGFRVLTAGIDLTRFQSNPVMLYAHDNMRLPIGRWENVRVEGDRLLADAWFDEADPFASEVARKVEAGLLRNCSISFEFLAFSEDPADMLPGQTRPTASKTRLLECSICPVGSNPGAVRLAADAAPTVGTFINLNHTQSINPQNQQTMTEQEKQQMAQLQQQVQQLTADNASLTAERDNLREAARLAHEIEIDAILNAALKDGRITKAETDSWRALLTADTENARKSLEALSPRASLSQMMKDQQGKNEFSGKDWDALDRAGQLAAFKQADPDGFKDLYKRRFGVDYIG